MVEKFDVIVVGGGLSGNGAGALLSQNGKKVLVLEKHPYLGGRATSFEYKGYTLNIGQHAGLAGGRVDALFETLGKDMGTKGYYEELSLWKDGETKNLLEMVVVDKPDEAVNVMNAMRGLSEDDLAKLDNIPGDQWLKQYVTDPKLWFLMHMNATTCASTRRMEDMAASTVIEASRTTQRSTQTYMMDKGYGSLSKILADTIKENGGDVRVRARVHDIVVESGKVAGVSVEYGDAPPDGNVEEMAFVETPVVVAAFPVWDLFKVIRKEYFEPKFVQQCLHLDRRTGNIGFITGLKGPIFEEKRFFFADIPQKNDVPLPLTVLPTSNICPSTAPAGKSLCEFLCLCEPEQVENPNEMRRIIEDMKAFANEMLPGFMNKVEWLRTFYHWEEPMRTAGRMGIYRPGPKAPSVEGLYLAGDTVNSRALPGLECSCDSAVICAEAVLGKELQNKDWRS